MLHQIVPCLQMMTFQVAKKWALRETLTFGFEKHLANLGFFTAVSECHLMVEWFNEFMFCTSCRRHQAIWRAVIRSEIWVYTQKLILEIIVRWYCSNNLKKKSHYKITYCCTVSTKYSVGLLTLLLLFIFLQFISCEAFYIVPFLLQHVGTFLLNHWEEESHLGPVYLIGSDNNPLTC